jgi:outer membrane protein assembly factor BamB
MKLLSAAAAVGLLTLTLHAENWPCWRGPRGDGSSLETAPPTQWSDTNNIVWKAPLPGQGHSSPILWGNRIFVTTAIKDTQERLLLSLDAATGKELWRQTVLRAPLEAKHDENSYASATPATDGEKVYVTFLDGKEVVAAAYDFSGKQVWLARPGAFYSQWGFSHTPSLFEDKVIIACDSKGENFIVALSRADGKQLWKIARTNATQSYSAPLIAKLDGRDQLIIPGNKAVTSYNPRTGEQLWVFNGPSEDCVSTPVYNQKADLVLSSSSWPKRALVAIHPDGQGDITQSKLAWSTQDGAPYIPSPISVGDWFLTVSFTSREAICYEAATGKILWREKVGFCHASPVSAGNLVYFTSDDGVTTIIKAGLAPEVIARNALGEKTYSSIALSSGRLYLRTFNHLYCIGSVK